MATDNVEATSLLGAPLRTPEFADEARGRLEGQYAEARAGYDAHPDDAEAILLLGQRAGYLGRMREAITLFGEGMTKHPEDPRFPRYRGHRHLSVRRFDRAIADLEGATRLVEGQPPQPELPAGAAKGTPTTTTLQFSIWYHLGLARYLSRGFAEAAAAYAACTPFAPDDDPLVAVTHWHYMASRRAGDVAGADRVLAPIHPDMQVAENVPYYRLCLLYAGVLAPEAVLDFKEGESGMDAALQDATAGYGVGNWHLYGGRRAEAGAIFRRILDATPPGIAQFAFGYIAAEAEVAETQ